jgi:ketosteroid isomerase-like protein
MEPDRANAGMAPVDIVRAAWEAYSAGDFVLTAGFMSPEVTLYQPADHGPQSFHGRDEVLRGLRAIAKSFSTFRITLTDLQAMGDRVFAHGVIHAEVDGVTVIERITTWLVTVAGGMIVRMEVKAVAGPHVRG